MKKEHFDVAIIGGGPAGLTASIYTSRANLKTVFIENNAPGGKMVKTSKIENWSGDISVDGPELSKRMFDHANASGAIYKYYPVKQVISHNQFNHELILTNGEIIVAKAVIIATGMVERKPLSVKNIEKFEGRGVYYCAICDGPLFKNQVVAVIGGGNSAIEESVYLSSIAKQVYIFVRKKEELWAEKILIDQVAKRSNITLYIEGEILELDGKEFVETAKVKINNKQKQINLNAVFPYIGHIPATDFVKDLGVTDKTGFIPTDEFMETKVKGIYAIGDVRVKHIRQIATAVNDGVIAGKIIANRI